MSADNKPMVSIGLPVFNGALYISEAIDSILAQTFTDLELIISDNGSTDETPAICSDYAARDPRIRYYRCEVNRGAAWNFNRVFELSTGTYFKWAAHDDVLAKEYLEECVKILDVNSDVVVCYTRWMDIDSNGREIGKKKSTLVSGFKRQDHRFRDIIDRWHSCEEVFGVIRSEILKKTDLIQSYAASDRVLLSELGLIGLFYEVPEYLFYHREHDKRSVEEYPSRIDRAVWFDTSAEGKIVLPYWREVFEYGKVVYRNPITLMAKLRCYGHLAGLIWEIRRPLRLDIRSTVRTLLLRYAPWTRHIWRVLKKGMSVGRSRSV